MQSCLVWAMGLLFGWLAILAWHILGGEPVVLLNGLAYAGLGVAAMALVSRCAPAGHPALKRISALLSCAILAGIDIGLSGTRGEAGQKLFFAALLGIALVVLVARHAPAGLRQRWLGKDSA